MRTSDSLQRNTIRKDWGRQPFFVRAADTKVELWSGYRIQFGGMERHDWQTVLKAQCKEALSRRVRRSPTTTPVPTRASQTWN